MCDVQLAEAIFLLDSSAFAWTELARLSKHVSSMIKCVFIGLWCNCGETSSRWLISSLTEKLKQSHEADVLDIVKCDVFDKHDRNGKTDRAASEQYQTFTEKIFCSTFTLTEELDLAYRTWRAMCVSSVSFLSIRKHSSVSKIFHTDLKNDQNALGQNMLVPPAPSQQTAQRMKLEQNPSLNSNSPKSYGNIALTESEVSLLTSLQGVTWQHM